MDLSYFSNLLRISEDELKKLIKKKIEEFYNLIDEETALLLILKDFGINIKEIGKWKVKDLMYGLKISEISVVVGKKLLEKENLAIFEVYDDTGKVKLILKDSALKIKDQLFRGRIIRIKNAIVLRNKTLALFVNNPKLIEEEKNKDVIERLMNAQENTGYISEFFGKVLKKEDSLYHILTDNFDLLKATSDIELEIGKTYHFKTVLGNPSKIFYAQEINLEKALPKNL